ncbi:MAG: YbaK/EbsC family protein [Gammaproteobacteria bacterium]|nr:MAG: YbaK/EbsC family protein [Gammaproteobacteria bacterium]UCH38864.1 MAG: YbaK/EbsC family protein [Gammaproteobacteria bacterium]
MPGQILKNMLDERNIKYISINHSPAYTARETAASTFIPRREFAKTIIVDLDGDKVMAVVSASRHVDLAALRELAGASEARLATEEEFKALFPDCEIGAMPPFGSLYQLRLFVDEMVTEVDDLCFNAGTHEQILRMDCGDYLEIEEPVIGDFAIKE